MAVSRLLDIIALILVVLGLLICVMGAENKRAGLATAMIQSGIALGVIAITIGGHL